MIPETKHGTVLVVDDEPANLGVLFEALKAAQFNVLLTTCGANAIRSAEKEPPDIVLLDIGLPDMDGFQLYQRLRTLAPLQGTPFVFLSSRDELEAKLTGIGMNAVDYITKPFAAAEVVARVKKHLKIRRLQIQLEDRNQELQEQISRFKTLEEATFEGVVIHDGDRILEVNTRIKDLCGRPRSEIIDQPPLDFIAPDARTLVAEYLRIERQMPYQTEILHRDGSRIPVEIQARPMQYDGRTVRVAIVRDLRYQEALERENLTLKATLSGRQFLGELVGKSAVMQKVYERIIKAAASDETVIIYGETGTGKELAARTVFSLRDHHVKEFVAVNCGALQETLFESHFFGHRKGAFTGAERNAEGYFDQAKGGTLFLDEIGELTPTMQAKLLRVLSDGTYTPFGDTAVRVADVRLIAATNKNLRELVRQGEMREDFFHRLHVIALNMPPLRQHKDDIPLLIDHFREQRADRGLPISPVLPDVLDRFMDYAWPGNIRELFNELRRYFVTGVCELDGAPGNLNVSSSELPALQEGHSLNETMTAFEKSYLARIMKQFDRHRGRAADHLGIDRRTLYSKLKKYDLL